MNALVRGVLHKITRAAETAPAWSERAEATVRSLAGVVSPVGDSLIAVVRAAALPLTARVVAYQAALAITAAVDPAAAVALGEQLLAEVEASPAAHQALALCYRAVHAIERPRVLLERARALGGTGRLAFAPLARLNDLARWAAMGLPLSPPQPRAYEPEPRRVVYVVSSSHPYHAVGYTTRSHALVTALVRRGWDMHLVARAGYPSDRWDYPHWALPPRRLDLDGVPHHFAPTRAKLRYARALEAYHREAADALEAQCRALRPAVIHAASNYNVGLAAVEVGRRLGVPVIYEVRGLWHVSKTVASPHYADSDHYRLIERLEAQAAAAADHTFAITSGVADVLSAAGVPADKLSLLGNAADVAAFTPQPPDPARVAALGLAGKVVVGYVGSLRRYEGLDDLLVAVAALPDTLRAQLAVLIVGDGEQRGPLTEQAAALGLSGLVTFTGRIPAAEAPSYYAILDLLVLPRIPTLVCELVSPIKSFEAMAMGKPVLASDVAALSDIITDGVTGRLFRKGDRADLSRILGELVGDRTQRERLGQTAAAWVRRTRTWDVLASEVEAVYLSLTNAYATSRHDRG